MKALAEFHPALFEALFGKTSNPSANRNVSPEASEVGPKEAITKGSAQII